MTSERRILLYWMDQTSVIISCPSGVVYQNQVGGVMNYQEELEGVLVPMGLSYKEMDEIAAYPYEIGVLGISEEIADGIDEILAKHVGTSFVSVDRSRLGDSCEAWIFVDVKDLGPDAPHRVIYGEPQRAQFLGPIGGFGNAKGVLTW